MRDILALDLATATGWAIGPPGGQPKYGCFRLPSTGNDIGRFAAAYDEWLCNLIERHDVALVSFEAPILPKQTTPATARKLMGLCWHTEFVCADFGVRVFESNYATVKKFFTGNGHAKPFEVAEACRRYGWEPKEDNAADALAHWAFTVHCNARKYDGRFSTGALVPLRP